MSTPNNEIFKPSEELGTLLTNKLSEMHTEDEGDFQQPDDELEVDAGSDASAEKSNVTNLPKGAGMVDYSGVTFKQGDLLEVESLRASGVNVLDLTIPTKVREASLDANGKQKMSKNGKPLFKFLNLNYPDRKSVV